MKDGFIHLEKDGQMPSEEEIQGFIEKQRQAEEAEAKLKEEDETKPVADKKEKKEKKVEDKPVVKQPEGAAAKENILQQPVGDVPSQEDIFAFIDQQKAAAEQREKKARDQHDIKQPGERVVKIETADGEKEHDEL